MNTAELIEAVKVVAALTAFAVGLVQYRRSQSWKRMEFVAQEMNKLRSDPMVKDVFLLLDWELRSMDFGLKNDDGKPRIIRVTYDLTKRALAPHYAAPAHFEFDVVEVAIRDRFDIFLDYLVHFENFVQAGLVRPQDIEPYLEYWANALAGSGDIAKPLLQAFWNFVDTYGYLKARKLLTRLKPQIRSLFPPRSREEVIAAAAASASDTFRIGKPPAV